MDGGFRSWITRIENNSPHLDDYGKPLPPPPPGFYWSREQDGSWVILHYSTHHSSKSKEDAFVTVENSSVVEHVVLPGDTLQGLCLRYGVSAVALRQLNNFSGNAFRSRKVLRVPLEKGATVRPQEYTSEVLIQQFKNTTGESDMEAKYYLQEHDWDLSKALSEWSGDEGWVREEETLKAHYTNQHTHQQSEDEEDTPLLHSVKLPEGVEVVQPLEIVIACASTSS